MDLQIMQEGINDGLLLVIDMTGLVFGHLTKLSLITMKKFLQYLQVYIFIINNNNLNIFKNL